MDDREVVKKKRKPKRSSKCTIRSKSKSTFPTLAHIVLSNGSRVDIPKLPTTSSPLTSYDHLRIALEMVACAFTRVREAQFSSVPKLMLTSDWDNTRMNLEDSLNHLHYAIQDFPKGAGSS